ncbi:YggT family protein [Cytobacillus eiseniae]|uniref:YggT family protein n=1 Tax=Cytobacillus eiseniae TaxID=762947 RepID=A0ABS4RAY0_9BACI|nr:YggT family protein [Cytobacillus eiseniae]MBP2240052.1 YggT family protein [Cytobacillus eiseniae]
MYTLYSVLSTLIYFYSWGLIIYILLSWFPNAKESAIGQLLARICEPYLDPFRKIIPPLGMIDISPIVAILVLRLADGGLKQLFLWIA